jgi:CDP-glucose 4,6-dehydratase
VENMGMTNFWNNKKVFITGHTGFKGTWLALWLHKLGADVTGYSLLPSTDPSLYELAHLEGVVKSVKGDIRDLELLKKTLDEARPEIIFHMAAQPLVRESYRNPIETYSTNVMGTLNLLEAARISGKVNVIVNITTDKCYENKEWYWAYRENEPLGGYDPYSSSKACSELITSAYRNSYFNQSTYDRHGTALASARAGNVIGGGDWSADRLIPDCIRSLINNKQIIIRNPESIRPWQHVLEPLGGYISLAQRLFEKGPDFAEAWNFGPSENDAKPVKWIVERLCEHWENNVGFMIDKSEQPHEASYLKLDSSKAKLKLGWSSKWDLETALVKVIKWNQAYKEGADIKDVCFKQIQEYENLPDI